MTYTSAGWRWMTKTTPLPKNSYGFLKVQTFKRYLSTFDGNSIISSQVTAGLVIFDYKRFKTISSADLALFMIRKMVLNRKLD